MRTHAHRRAAVAAMAVVAALALSACTAGGDAASDGKLRIFMPQGPDVQYPSNAFTEELEKKFDVDIDFETTTFDPSAAAEKRQISLAGGDYPDAYMLVPWINQFNQSELLKLGKQGVLVELNDLIAEHGPNITAAFEETPEFKALATSPSGKIWGLPQWNDCFHCSYTYKLWMNSDWLDAVGLAQPTTPEELRDVLRAFKTQDPNGNGVADEIPLSGSVGNEILPYLMNPFIYTAFTDATGSRPASLALDGDTVVLQAIKDGWREGLEYIHSLWEEGLIDEAAISQNADALKAKGDNSGTVIVGAVTGQHPAVLTSLGQDDGRDKQYDAVPPLTGPNGSPASYLLPSYPGGTFVITNKATEEEREKLIEIIDYIVTTDGHLPAEFGVEGVNWGTAEPGDVALDESIEPVFKVLTPEEGEGVNNAWGPLAQYYSSAQFRGSQAVPTDIYEPSGFERRLFEATQPYAQNKSDEVFPFWNVWVPEDRAADLAIAQTNVEGFIAQASAEFITGTKDITDDAQWQQYLDGVAANGGDTYVSIYQDAWDESR